MRPRPAEATILVPISLSSDCPASKALAWALRKPEVPEETKRRLAEPIAALFRRGAADGAWRTELSDETLLSMYLALAVGALHEKLHHRMGVEPAAAAVTSVFLDGAAARR